MTQPASIQRVRGHRPRLLDLYCCAGGAGTGCARAGFTVDGCDLVDTRTTGEMRSPTSRRA